MENYKQFLVTLSSAGVVGVIAIIFVLRWVLYYQRGLAWDGGQAEFNWHPVLNVCGFIILQGLGEFSFFLFLWAEEVKRFELHVMTHFILSWMINSSFEHANHHVCSSAAMFSNVFVEQR